MSPALADIVALSEQLRMLAGQQEWQVMLDVARTRQQRLEQYFSLQPPPDAVELIQATMASIQKTDNLLAKDAGGHRQQLLKDAVDLRQRWQMSNTYQSVQNLQP